MCASVHCASSSVLCLWFHSVKAEAHSTKQSQWAFHNGLNPRGIWCQWHAEFIRQSLSSRFEANQCFRCLFSPSSRKCLCECRWSGSSWCRADGFVWQKWAAADLASWSTWPGLEGKKEFIVWLVKDHEYFFYLCITFSISPVGRLMQDLTIRKAQARNVEKSLSERLLTSMKRQWVACCVIQELSVFYCICTAPKRNHIFKQSP